ncbi:hypothetical protein MVES1_003008 [Malassezia vespertilionis]|uniref:Uncharacterized protein n=1 Tax=Malassezia vespertilionis TaxID=2020962 RepID=A0A2N1J900_9BASI|nr:uncharacterized protein MVES1_003008 [Malassezia vespertilionis]PKI83004.1 hypothetical protein MVES_002848 [Malassezia vespertilionis]WFD07639.1 hypothetical protein MVES1_003008 [Malassezia vespertilionis]
MPGSFRRVTPDANLQSGWSGTGNSSSDSGTSPMFSDLGTITSRSTEMNDNFRRTMQSSTPENSMCTAPTSQCRGKHGLGLSFSSDMDGTPRDLSVAHTCIQNSRAALAPRHLDSSRSTESYSTPPSRRGQESPRSVQFFAQGTPIHGSLDTLYPSVAYAESEASAASPGAFSPHTNDDVRVALPEYEVETAAALRPLNLVSKYFGDGGVDRTPDTSQVYGQALSGSPQGAQRFETSVELGEDETRPPSPGALHGLSVDALPMPELLTPPNVPLRTLHLPTLHSIQETHEPSQRIPQKDHISTPTTYTAFGDLLPPLPAFAGDETVSSASSRGSSRRRLPYAALHPPAPPEEYNVDARRMFWFGFLGMPWLWLLGSWCMDDTGTLVAPWSTPSFSTYRSGLHPYGAPLALSAKAYRNNAAKPGMDLAQPNVSSPHVSDLDALARKHEGVRFLQEKQRQAPKPVSLFAVKHWRQIEPFVLYNRLAAAISSFVIFACWAVGIWAVVAHF